MCLFAYNLPQTFSLAIIFINLIRRQDVSLLVELASFDNQKDKYFFLIFSMISILDSVCVCVCVCVCVKCLFRSLVCVFPLGVLDFSNS